MINNISEEQWGKFRQLLFQFLSPKDYISSKEERQAFGDPSGNRTRDFRDESPTS